MHSPTPVTAPQSANNFIVYFTHNEQKSSSNLPKSSSRDVSYEKLKTDLKDE